MSSKARRSRVYCWGLKAHHVQWTFEAYASGNWSMPEIAKALNERGLRTRGIHGRHGKDVHTTHVEGILKNPYYCGVVVYEGVEYPGRHTPLVEANGREPLTAGEERDPEGEGPVVVAEAGGGGQMFSRALQVARAVGVEAESKNRAPLWERGSNFSYVVAATGIEPVTLGL